MVREKELKLVQLFRYGVGRSGPALDVARVDGKLSFVATPLASAGEWAEPVTIVCDKLIDAAGADIKPKEGFRFPGLEAASSSARGQIYSLSPRDITTPRVDSLLRYSKHADKPIWVIGSGKTAMDTICVLDRMGPEISRRVRCISGWV